MSNYKIETKCIQSGYEPGNGEPRVLPIYQSTTFKYATSEEMGKTVRSGGRGIFLIPRLQNPTNDVVAQKNLRSGGRRGSHAHIFRPGGNDACCYQHL